MEKKIFAEISAKKGTFIAAILLIAGLAILLISGESKSDNKGISDFDGESLTAYSTKLEKDLSEIVSSIEGAGKAQVMITFDSSFESVYAYNAGVSESSIGSSGRSTEKELVLTGNRNEEAPVLVKRLNPKVKGVLVVCEGGSIPSVSSKITSAAETLFGISENRICVTEGTKSIQQK